MAAYPICIRRAVNGYIVDVENKERVYQTLDEVFTELLMTFEGRADTFTGKSFGRVVVSRERHEEAITT